VDTNEQEHIQDNQLRISPAFATLLALLTAREIRFTVYRLMEKAPAGLYVEIYNQAGFYELSIGDYQWGIEWSFYNGEFTAESSMKPFTSLDACLKVMDAILLWEAANPDADILYPGLVWQQLGVKADE
jgi:hypothetical protein